MVSLKKILKKRQVQTCDCGNPSCTREVKGAPSGSLYVINHFTCDKTKKQMKELMSIK